MCITCTCKQKGDQICVNCGSRNERCFVWLGGGTYNPLSLSKVPAVKDERLLAAMQNKN